MVAIIILQCYICNYHVCPYLAEPTNVWQSPSVISIPYFQKALTLFCLPSVHPDCTYSWNAIGEKFERFPSSPVIYVEKAGLYQCTITFGVNYLLSTAMAVRVDVGMHFIYYNYIVKMKIYV